MEKNYNNFIVTLCFNSTDLKKCPSYRRDSKFNKITQKCTNNSVLEKRTQLQTIPTMHNLNERY